MKTLEMEAPMSLDEVKKLKTIKAAATEKALETNKSFKAPEMEIIDGRSYPKGTEAIGVKAGEKSFDDEVTETEGFCPADVEVDYVPKAESKKNRKPAFFEKETFAATKGEKTVFSPDQRIVFNSSAYPWRCVGRVETSLGFASGIMIGPRHMLTCSHIVDWQPNNLTGWMKFTPMYYNGSAPYGSLWAIKTYYKFKVSAAGGIDSTEIQYDYVVVVLNAPVGNSIGFLGAKAYTDAWDGQAVWTHAGYPMDLTGGQRPTYQTGIALDGDAGSADDNESMIHKGDVSVGQSGGPFWGYWGGQPFAVATQSAHNPSINFASGGSDLLSLVNKARAEFP